MCFNEKYGILCICKQFSDSFPIQNGLKQDSLPPFFYFALEYAIRKFQENQVGLKLNGTHQLLAYVGDVTLQWHNTETVTNASKEVGLEVNADKTKYMLVSRHQDASQDWDIKNSKQII
jgi:hypothetical protein